jgi:BirA family biotin operon repressor/biotin-[acetyl-CoA-carboxylase] ligase
MDWTIQTYQEVDSTQILVHKAAQDHADEGLVVQSMIQLGGKGRRGSQWVSPVGNLYLSVLLRPDCSTQEAGQLSFVVAVAMREALEGYIDADRHTLSVKWPNDILADGLKMAGILIENGGDYLVIGTGVNIFNKPELAICLNDIAKEPVYINKVRDNYLQNLSYYYDLWQEKGFAPVLELWLNKAHGLNQPMTARLPNAEFKGVFKTVQDDGALVLALEDGNQKIIHAAEVYFGEAG